MCVCRPSIHPSVPYVFLRLSVRLLDCLRENLFGGGDEMARLLETAAEFLARPSNDPVGIASVCK